MVAGGGGRGRGASAGERPQNVSGSDPFFHLYLYAGAALGVAFATTSRIDLSHLSLPCNVNEGTQGLRSMNGNGSRFIP